MQSAANEYRERNFSFINSTKSIRNLHEKILFNYFSNCVPYLGETRAPTEREKCNVTRKNTVSCILAWFSLLANNDFFHGF